MHKLTALVLRHRLAVLLVWIALLVVGALFVGKANSGLSHSFATPGLQGYDANQAMVRQALFDGGEAPVIAVLRLPAGRSMNTAAGQADASRVFTAAARRGHVGLIHYATSHNHRLVSGDGQTTWGSVRHAQPRHRGLHEYSARDRAGAQAGAAGRACPSPSPVMRHCSRPDRAADRASARSTRH